MQLQLRQNKQNKLFLYLHSTAAENLEAWIDECLVVIRGFVGSVINRVGREIERAVKRETEISGRDTETTYERRKVTARAENRDVRPTLVSITTRVAPTPSVVDRSASASHLLCVWIVHLPTSLSKRYIDFISHKYSNNTRAHRQAFFPLFDGGRLCGGGRQAAPERL